MKAEDNQSAQSKSYQPIPAGDESQIPTMGKTSKRISDSAFVQNQIGGNSEGLIPRRQAAAGKHMTDSAFVTGTMTLKRNVVSLLFYSWKSSWDAVF